MMKECHTVAQVYGFLSPVKLQTSQFKEDTVNSEKGQGRATRMGKGEEQLN